jgi:cytochrome P450
MTGTRLDITEELDALLGGDPERLARSFDIYAEMREQGRTYEHGPTVFVTRYEDVVAATKDADTLGNRLTTGTRFVEARARLSDGELEIHDEVQHVFDAFASRHDGPSHIAIRRAAHRAFTARRIAALETATEAYTTELLDAVEQEGGVVDLMEFAYRLPLRVIGDLLGVREEDREAVHEWSVLIGGAIGATDMPSLRRARDGIRGLRGFIDGLLQEHRAAPDAPSTDLVGLLLEADETGRMGEWELTGMYLQLLFAGHETTTNLIGIGMAELLSAPQQWRALVAQPEAVPAAIEELLRFVSPTQFMGRVALRDCEIAGTPIRQGQSVMLAFAAANRDPRRWADPDVLRIDREDARDHISFGRGPHFCLGSSLARLEARIAITQLARRFGDLEPVDEPRRWSGGAMLRHLDHLRVDLGRSRA